MNLIRIRRRNARNGVINAMKLCTLKVLYIFEKWRTLDLVFSLGSLVRFFFIIIIYSHRFECKTHGERLTPNKNNTIKCKNDSNFTPVAYRLFWCGKYMTKKSRVSVKRHTIYNKQKAGESQRKANKQRAEQKKKL